MQAVPKLVGSQGPEFEMGVYGVQLSQEKVLSGLRTIEDKLASLASEGQQGPDICKETWPQCRRSWFL